MEHFMDRNDLMLWLENNVPRKAIEYAMVDGKIELLGAFSSITANSNSGWIVKVTSKRGLSWNIAIVPSNTKHTYFAYTIKEVPWEYYMGGNRTLFAGDHPEVYKELKNAENK